MVDAAIIAKSGELFRGSLSAAQNLGCIKHLKTGTIIVSVIRISSLVISAAMLFASSAYAATAQEKAAEKAAFALNASADAVKVTEVKRSGIKLLIKRITQAVFTTVTTLT